MTTEDLMLDQESFGKLIEPRHEKIRLRDLRPDKLES